MKYVLTDDRGQRIGHPVTERKVIRQVARSHIRAGKRVMIFLAHDGGTIHSYSHSDNEAVYRK